MKWMKRFSIILIPLMLISLIPIDITARGGGRGGGGFRGGGGRGFGGGGFRGGGFRGGGRSFAGGRGFGGGRVGGLGGGRGFRGGRIGRPMGSGLRPGGMRPGSMRPGAGRFGGRGRGIGGRGGRFGGRGGRFAGRGRGFNRGWNHGWHRPGYPFYGGWWGGYGGWWGIPWFVGLTTWPLLWSWWGASSGGDTYEGDTYVTYQSSDDQGSYYDDADDVQSLWHIFNKTEKPITISIDSNKYTLQPGQRLETPPSSTMQFDAYESDGTTLLGTFEYGPSDDIVNLTMDGNKQLKATVVH